ncbi:hypothetical protein MTO96_033526 [Rhipicephalus appendiculatus]
MNCSGLAPPPPFLLSPGRPVVPWEQWHRMFETYLLASVASEFSPQRRRAILIHCLGMITENKRHLTLTSACTLDSCRDAIMRMARSDVLISGIGGLGVELAKNVVVAGVRSVTVHDDPSVHR